MKGDTPWPASGPADGGDDAAQRSSRARPAAFPLIWVLVFGVLLAIVRVGASDAPRGESEAFASGYLAGRFVAALLIPLGVAGLVWLFGKRRDLTIGVAGAVTLAAMVGANTGGRAATRAFEAQLDARLEALSDDLLAVTEAGGVDPATLQEVGDATARERRFAALVARAKALLEELESGDGFGSRLDDDDRDRAWQALREGRWWRDSRELLRAEVEFLDGCREYSALLAAHPGRWRMEDGSVAFDEAVPSADVDAFCEAADRLGRAAAELGRVAEELERK